LSFKGHLSIPSIFSFEISNLQKILFEEKIKKEALNASITKIIYKYKIKTFAYIQK